MICLFRDGILAGLQFEMEEPPYRIRADYLMEVPAYVKAGPLNYDYPTAAAPYKRGEDLYIALKVHVRAAPLDEELKQEIVVYVLDRSW